METGYIRYAYTGDYSEDTWWIDKKCPKCGKQLQQYNGGDQGGVPMEFCSGTDDGSCNYERRWL